MSKVVVKKTTKPRVILKPPTATRTTRSTTQSLSEGQEEPDNPSVEAPDEAIPTDGQGVASSDTPEATKSPDTDPKGQPNDNSVKLDLCNASISSIGTRLTDAERRQRPSETVEGTPSEANPSNRIGQSCRETNNLEDMYAELDPSINCVPNNTPRRNASSSIEPTPNSD